MAASNGLGQSMWASTPTKFAPTHQSYYSRRASNPNNSFFNRSNATPAALPAPPVTKNQFDPSSPAPTSSAVRQNPFAPQSPLATTSNFLQNPFAARSPPPATSSAPQTPFPARGSESPPPKPQIPYAATLQRLEQTLARLEWKFLDLVNAYHRTVKPSEHNFAPDIAERNFKIDFFELYAWIEQALVLSLRIFGVEIDGGRGYNGQHMFHHNVIQELRCPTNPLHEVLGQGNGMHALGKAKELRNKWKDAGNPVTDTTPVFLQNLEWMFEKLFAGLKDAYNLAKEEALRNLTSQGEEAQLIVNGGQGAQEEWQWMVHDQMEWQA